LPSTHTSLEKRPVSQICKFTNKWRLPPVPGHAPWVLRLCRRHLGRYQDAEGGCSPTGWMLVGTGDLDLQPAELSIPFPLVSDLGHGRHDNHRSRHACRRTLLSVTFFRGKSIYQ
jgi:hypothetical protein